MRPRLLPLLPAATAIALAGCQLPQTPASAAVVEPSGISSSYGTVFIEMSDGSTCRIPKSRELTYTGTLKDCPHPWPYTVEEETLNLIQALALTAELAGSIMGDPPPDRVFDATVTLTAPDGRSFTLTHKPTDQRGPQ